MTEDDFKRIEQMMAHQVSIAIENYRHKFKILVEGHPILLECMGRMETRMKRGKSNVDGIAADLTVLRAETIAHHGSY